MNKEIKIPEGYEARIEGNKVVFISKESEDERIRGCIGMILTDATEQRFKDFGVSLKDCIAYLEKQKDASKAIEAVERIDRYIDEEVVNAHDMKDSNPTKQYFRGWDDALGEMSRILQDVYSNEKQKEEPIKVEVYEIGKGTTICGQDYKCKKDYRSGTCWYIKDVIYHCGRDGYLTDQNGVSWSCTPEWFKEYIQSNTEWAEDEKNRFVSGQYLQCIYSFDEFREGEHYWLEYVGDDMYVGRSDNILNQKFHITPRQLYTLFSQELEEKQEEQKPVKYLDKDKVYDIMVKLIDLSYSTLIPINSDEYKQLNEITKDVRDLFDNPPTDYPYLSGWKKNCDDNKPELKRSVLMLTTHGVAEGEWLGDKWCQYRWSCELKDGEVLYWMHLSDLERLEKDVEEKQEEQKPVEPSDDELQRHQDELYDFKVFAAKQAREHHISFVHDFEWNNFCAGILSYFNEKQKPIEWSKEDEELFNDALAGLKYAYEDLINNNSLDSAKDIKEAFDWMQAKIKNFRPQPKQEWSEEDERMLSRCVKSIETSKQFSDISDTFKQAKDEEISWLKFLPERLNLQPKSR